MKIRLFAALMIALLCISLFAGCQASRLVENIRLLPGGNENQALSAAKHTPENNQTTNMLTPEEAKAAALAHAGITQAQAWQRTELDRDDGRLVYDVEFYAADREYDYEIDAFTGAVVKHEVEYKGPAPTQQTLLTQAQAVEIALRQAGLSQAQVTGLRVTPDEDDGRPEYEVEFRFDGWEYDYEIHGVTGEILSHDKERERG